MGWKGKGVGKGRRGPKGQTHELSGRHEKVYEECARVGVEVQGWNRNGCTHQSGLLARVCARALVITSNLVFIGDVGWGLG